MSEEEKTRGFWSTLPGVLTGVAAVITAVAGLVLGLYQYGVLDSKPTGSSDSAAKSMSGSSKSSAESSVRHQDPHESTLVITAEDGTVTSVFAGSFRHTQSDREIILQNGQHVSLDNIKKFEVVRHYDFEAKVRITLLNDTVVEGSIDEGSSVFGFTAKNDIGKFEISVSKLKRFVLQE